MRTELENREKALTATIASPFPEREGLTFRYASLASGLEIMRKCLSKHEIATVQATAIEPETGLIKLTATLLPPPVNPPRIGRSARSAKRPPHTGWEWCSPTPAAMRAAHYGRHRRHRDRKHLRFIAGQPYMVCGRQSCDPHHLRFAQARGIGQKVSDEFTVPLCRAHHREPHRTDKEVNWWTRLGIDPLASAESLWRLSHPRSASDDGKTDSTTAQQ